MKLYWLLQLVGWGLFFALDTLIKVLAGSVDYPLFVAVFILYTFAMLVSHALRHWYRRWQRLHLLKVIAGVLGLSLLGGAVATSLLLIMLVLIQSPIIEQMAGSLHLLFLSNLLVIWAVLLLWSGLYFFITRQRKVNELESSHEDLQQNLQQAQLNALLTQLNPHFMFNCINNIRALILEDPANARDMLANLADMLRYNLQSDVQPTSTLASELSIVDTYVSLMKMQYESRLEFVVEVDSSVDNQHKVPRLLLQLLVENAIKHGIAKSARGGKITLTIGFELSSLVITVTNPGTLRPEQQGIGLENIRQRLVLLYGKEQSFNLAQQGEWVVAKIHLPTKVMQ